VIALAKELIRKKQNKISLKPGAIVYTCLIYIFLYLPIAVLIIYSFNDSPRGLIWSGFTTKWYHEALQDKALMAAFGNTLLIAVCSTVLSAMVGTIAAIGMYRYQFKGQGILDSLLYIPVVIPEIVLGIALLSFFSQMQLTLGVMTLIISHATFSIPFVIFTVRARLEGYDSSVEEAAMDLGAGRLATLFRITLPILAPGILAGCLLAFTLSLDDVVISFFTAGAESTTLPLMVFSMVRYGVSPKINALSTMLLLFIMLLVVTTQGRQLFRKKK
jgi:spermidine/putrescine transport system permease protein